MALYRLKVVATDAVIDFTDRGYQSQLPDHQRSTAVQAIRNNLKSTELQMCDSLSTKRQLVSDCIDCLIEFHLSILSQSSFN